MKRTVYYFKDEMLDSLDKLAKTTGLSRASIVRMMVGYMIPRWEDAYLKLKDTQEPYLELMGKKNGP